MKTFFLLCLLLMGCVTSWAQVRMDTLIIDSANVPATHVSYAQFSNMLATAKSGKRIVLSWREKYYTIDALDSIMRRHSITSMTWIEPSDSLRARRVSNVLMLKAQ